DVDAGDNFRAARGGIARAVRDDVGSAISVVAVRDDTGLSVHASVRSFPDRRDGGGSFGVAAENSGLARDRRFGIRGIASLFIVGDQVGMAARRRGYVAVEFSSADDLRGFRIARDFLLLLFDVAIQDAGSSRYGVAKLVFRTTGVVRTAGRSVPI